MLERHGELNWMHKYVNKRKKKKKQKPTCINASMNSTME